MNECPYDVRIGDVYTSSDRIEFVILDVYFFSGIWVCDWRWTDEALKNPIRTLGVVRGLHVTALLSMYKRVSRVEQPPVVRPAYKRGIEL